MHRNIPAVTTRFKQYPASYQTVNNGKDISLPEVCSQQFDCDIERIGDGPVDISIIIPSIESRRELRKVLIDNLKPQIGTAVEILICEDDGTIPSGYKRNKLLAASRGRYVTSIDDDDNVSTDYVSQIHKAIESKPDVVTFCLEYKTPDKTESWVFGKHFLDRTPIITGVVGMTANHLCVWKREVALSVPYSPIGYMDDVFWYRPLIASGIIKTSVHIEKILYYYDYSPVTTSNQSLLNRERTTQWGSGGIDYFWYNGKIAVAACGIDHLIPRATRMPVRLSGDIRSIVPTNALRKFHTIKVAHARADGLRRVR